MKDKWGGLVEHSEGTKLKGGNLPLGIWVYVQENPDFKDGYGEYWPGGMLLVQFEPVYLKITMYRNETMAVNTLFHIGNVDVVDCQIRYEIELQGLR